MKPVLTGARLLALLAFAAAMGWLEGVVVVYIRALVGIPRGGELPDPEGVMERLRALPWLVPTEQSREIATLVMLAAVACVAARTRLGRLGALLLCFGAWDIVYYLALRLMLGWPPSLATMDLLFLVPPHPLWYQPVWVPVAISTLMVATGIVLFARDRPAPAGPPRPQEAKPAVR